MNPEPIADYCCDTGEGPTWHPGEQRLYWTDIPTGRVFRYSPAIGSHEQCYHGKLVAGLTVQDDGSFLMFGEHGAVNHWSDGKLLTVVGEIAAEVGTRFNDIAADPSGRIFCGTMSSKSHPGRLYRIDHDSSLTLMLEGILISNGIGFSPDKTVMYLSESVPGVIHAFDFDDSTGALSNRRVFAKVAPEDGVPDGLTVDAFGNVWSARWDGHCIVRYSPGGTIDFKIDFPVPKVSSLTFGGPNYTDLYVTTAGGFRKDVEGALAGALFVVKDAGQGVPDFRSKIAIRHQ